MNANELAVQILQLDAKEDLAVVYEAYRTRSRQLRDLRNMRASTSFKPGDRVRFSDETRPIRYRGMTAVIEKTLPNGKFSVRVERVHLDGSPAPVNPAAPTMRVPGVLLEKI